MVYALVIIQKTKRLCKSLIACMEMYENSIIKYSILLENMIEFSKTQVLKVRAGNRMER